MDARKACRSMVLFQTGLAKPSIIAKVSTVYAQKQNALGRNTMHHPQIALQKTLCLLLVIATHAILPFTTGNPFWKLYAGTQASGADMIAGIFAFSLVPSFIFASGFLLEQSVQNAACLGEIAGKRIKRLVWPWFLVMMFWLVPLYTLFDLPSYSRPEGASFWATLLAGIQGRFSDHLWFLLVLFWASLFWLVATPLLKLAPLDDVCAKMPKPDLRPWIEKGRALIMQQIPDWVKPEWFALKGEKPAIPLTDLVGLGLAFIVAVAIQVGGSNLTWFCFHETAGPVIFLYCGMLAYRHREWLDAFLRDNCNKVFPALALPFLILAPGGNAHFLFAWLLGVLGALLTYAACLMLANSCICIKKTAPMYAYFEKNAFRFYLFHMPIALIVFRGLNALDFLPPWICIVATFVLTLVVTAGVVRCSHLLEQNQLPKIVAGMQPKN